MPSAAKEFVVSYSSPTAFVEAQKKLYLVTAPTECPPPFLEGTPASPQLFSACLLALSALVRSHFFQMRPPFTDPVITCHDDLLRLEGLSTCCGVYARIDMDTEFLSPEEVRRGTTNVEFGDQMRSALSAFCAHEEPLLMVGSEGVELKAGGRTLVEKRVPLPDRWIKGFSEVQAYLASMDQVAELPRAKCLQFFRSLPRTTTQVKGDAFVTWDSGTLRMTQNPSGGFPLPGIHRLGIIPQFLVKHCRSVRLWHASDSNCTAWELLFDGARFTLALSPELRRGFSGEGQLLELLATREADLELPFVEAELNWQSSVSVTSVAKRYGLAEDCVRNALIGLGGKGQVGYDLSRGAFFHRQLPFRHRSIETTQPRLRGARKLVAEGKVARLHDSTFEVQGTDVIHRVSLEPDNSCTCRWYAKHKGKRGPCKHVLAARIVSHERTT